MYKLDQKNLEEVIGGFSSLGWYKFENSYSTLERKIPDGWILCEECQELMPADNVHYHFA